MKANRMPPVENKFCDARSDKKAPRGGAFLRDEQTDQLTFVTSAACGPF
jgi:hypothetical protein